MCKTILHSKTYSYGALIDSILPGALKIPDERELCWVVEIALESGSGGTVTSSQRSSHDNEITHTYLEMRSWTRLKVIAL